MLGLVWLMGIMLILNRSLRLILVQKKGILWRILEVCVFLYDFFFVLSFMFSNFPDERLLFLARENGALLVQSMFCKVLLMITREEEELAILCLKVRTLELAARVIMDSKVVSGVRGLKLEVIQVEVDRLVGLLEGYKSCERELSGLNSVVLEMQMFEASSNEVAEFGFQRLQDFCEEMMFSLGNIVADWGGACSV